MQYITSDTIKLLRKKQNITQKQLADKLFVTDKAVSKWENGRGLPDIIIVPKLAEALGVSVAELFTGNIQTNKNTRADMRNSKFYVCPICANVIHSIGEGSFSCCGVLLPVLCAEESDDEHKIEISENDGDLYVEVKSKMQKDDYVSFIACVDQDSVQIKKLYPEQSAEARFSIRRRGRIYAYYNRDLLFFADIK